MDEAVEQKDKRISDIDADIKGHLATALFIGVILVLLVVIYAFAVAA